MVSVTPCLTVLLTLIVWRLVFAGLQRKLLMRETEVPQRQNHTSLDFEAVIAIARNRFVNNSHGMEPVAGEDRAKTYLRRIVALTGATQTGNNYVLEVGTTRFQVRGRYVGRLMDVRDPKCRYEETCFCLPHKDMPKSEQIASALLQLKNNPALFERWAAQSGAFKADGQGFSRAR